jgi:hypothetical protein
LGGLGGRRGQEEREWRGDGGRGGGVRLGLVVSVVAGGDCGGDAREGEIVREARGGAAQPCTAKFCECDWL